MGFRTRLKYPAITGSELYNNSFRTIAEPQRITKNIILTPSCPFFLHQRNNFRQGSYLVDCTFEGNLCGTNLCSGFMNILRPMKFIIIKKYVDNLKVYDYLLKMILSNTFHLRIFFNKIYNLDTF